MSMNTLLGAYQLLQQKETLYSVQLAKMRVFPSGDIGFEPGCSLETVLFAKEERDRAFQLYAEEMRSFCREA